MRLPATRRGKRPAYAEVWRALADGSAALCVVAEDRPGLHSVGVEQQQPDGSWKMIQSCFTIEFQTRAAQPRGTMEHEPCR